jgi:hypothetical protein
MDPEEKLKKKEAKKKEKKAEAEEKTKSSKPVNQKPTKTSSSTLNPSALIGSLNSNTNVFSQLSALYLQRKNESDNSSTSSGSEKFKSIAKNADAEQEKLIITKFDGETQRVLQSLQKRSDVTKMKALNDLKEILENRDENFFDLFLPTWTYLYKQFMSSEYERKILEEVNQVLVIIVRKAKKSLASQFKELFPFWFLSINDMNSEVGNVAKKAFELAFPEEKHAQCLLVSEESYINNLVHFLNMDPKLIIQENSNLNEGQVMELYDRLVVSSLFSIVKAVEILKNHEKKNNFFRKIGEALELNKPERKRNIFIELLDNKKRVRPRAAALEAIAVMLTDFPSDIIEIQLIPSARAVLNVIDDKERMVQLALWKGVIVTVLKKCNETESFTKFEQKFLDVMVKKYILTLNKSKNFFKFKLIALSNLTNFS